MPEEIFKVETVVRWPDGNVSRRLVDWNDDWAMKNFARVARAALWKGAMVTSERVHVLEVDRGDD